MWACDVGGADVRVFRTDSEPRTSCSSAACRRRVRDNFRELGRAVDDGGRRVACDRRTVSPKRGGRSRPALELSRDNFTLERASRALALCGADEGASLSAELADRFPDATLTTRIQLPGDGRGVALRRGEPARALELLEPVKSVRSGAGVGVLARLSSRSGVPVVERRPGGQRAVPRILEHRGEAPDLAAVRAGAARARPRGGRSRGAVDEARKAYADVSSPSGPAPMRVFSREGSARGVRAASVGTLLPPSYRCRRYTSARRTCFSRRSTGRRPSAPPFVAEACGDDAALRQEVESLLRVPRRRRRRDRGGDRSEPRDDRVRAGRGVRRPLSDDRADRPGRHGRRLARRRPRRCRRRSR